MYEDGKKLDINWGSMIIKLIIFALILFIACFIFFKITNSDKGGSKNTLAIDNDKFTNNLYKMKETALEYFTKSRLPEKAGSMEKLTLKEMIDEKLIIDFTENGKNCSLEDSYIQATRTLNDNYAIKVSLTCGKKSDYIVSTIEKEEICKNNTCKSEEVKEEEVKKEEVITPPSIEESNSSSSNSSSSSSSSSNSSSNSNKTNSSEKKQKVTTTTITTTTITYRIRCINNCHCTTTTTSELK